MGIFDPGQMCRPGSWMLGGDSVQSGFSFALLVCPLVWGWKPDERLAEAPMALQKVTQTWEVN